MGLGSFARRWFFPPAPPVVETATHAPLQVCSNVPGRVSISACPPRSVCTVAGIVTDTRPSPPDTARTFEVVIEDEGGTQLTAIWHGRRNIPGLRVGVAVVLEGTALGSGGALRMLEPSYAILDQGA